MRRSRGAWTTATALFIASSLEALPADAETAVEEIEVSYEADARAGVCPSEVTFLAMVRHHTTKWNAVEQRAGVRSFRARLGLEDKAIGGTLVVTTPDGKTKTRELVGPDCEAVAEGLAVVMALAIDPEADLETGAPDTSDETRSPPMEQAPVEEASETPRQPAARAPAPRSRPAMQVAPPHARKPALTFAVGAGGELTSAVVRDALPVLAATFDGRVRFGADVPAWLAPSLALGLRQSLPKEMAGNSKFLWTALTIRLCPVRIAAFAGRLSFRPCVETDIGVLDAETRSIPNARGESSGWLDFAGSLRATFSLNQSWSVGASASVIAPRTRNRYALATGELISEPPTVGGSGGLFLELEL